MRSRTLNEVECGEFTLCLVNDEHKVEGGEMTVHQF